MMEALFGTCELLREEGGIDIQNQVLDALTLPYEQC